MENNAEQKDYLSDESFGLNHFTYASQGQRFLNWLIDNLFISFVMGYASGFVAGLILSQIAPDFLNRIAFVEQTGNRTFEFYMFSYTLGIFNYLVYYTLCEKLFKGYSLGKIITGTRAIRQDGEELSLKDAFLRSLTRCVPFELFSGFSTLTWHDKWTDTMVVKSR